MDEVQKTVRKPNESLFSFIDWFSIAERPIRELPMKDWEWLALRDLLGATPAVKQDLDSCGLNRGSGPPHLVDFTTNV